jgi:hypothetical protein
MSEDPGRTGGAGEKEADLREEERKIAEHEPAERDSEGETPTGREADRDSDLPASPPNAQPRG